ncbi:hypothetical protein Tco_0060307 [Tanacetum coccineum]
MKIHHNGEFFKPLERRYKFVVLDYVDPIDCDMFSIHELYGMLKELGLGDDNKILFMHFRIIGMSLDDGFVPLIANAYVIKLLNYVPTCKEAKVYIEAGVSLVEKHLAELLFSHSQSKGADIVSFMLDSPEIGKEEEHVDTSTHASTCDVYLVVYYRNDENVRNLDCDNDVSMEYI